MNMKFQGRNTHHIKIIDYYGISLIRFDDIKIPSLNEDYANGRTKVLEE